MEVLYGWAADILFFLVLMNLLDAMLPSGKYGRYIRFFAGMVLVLLTVRPFLDGLGLEAYIDRYFAEFSFQTEIQDLHRDVLGIEQQRRDAMIGSLEEEAARDVEVMVREAGLIPLQITAEIGKDTASDSYGQIVRIYMKVAGESGAAGDAGAGENSGIGPVDIRIEPVTITEPESGMVSENRVNGSEGSETPAASGGGTAASSEISPAGEEELIRRVCDLQRKVGQYYGLEPENVEVQLEKR